MSVAGMADGSCLVDRAAGRRALDRFGGRPAVHVGGPAGYGKTALVRQWADGLDRPVAWLTADEGDGDPVRFVHRLARALDRLSPLPGEVLTGPRGGHGVRDAVSLLCRVLAYHEPFVLVLDDAHHFGRDVAAHCLRPLIAGIPPGAQVVLVGRSLPPIRPSRLGVDGLLGHVGTAELALTRHEAALLLRGYGLDPSPAEVTGLLEATEGWAAGLRLATLGPDRGGRGGLAPPSGRDRAIAEYFLTEVVDPLPEEVAWFLLRTSVMDELSGALCDSVLETTGSGRLLRELDAANTFLVPLDGQRRRYRYHRLFADTLRAELAARDAGLATALRRRTGDWRRRHRHRSGPGGPGGGWAGRAPAAGATLTPAEQRVLALLPTHLSMAAIGDSLFLSRNTVKSHVVAVYRKLGVGTRGDAVEAARTRGLLGP